jgi:hypothetical protein
MSIDASIGSSYCVIIADLNFPFKYILSAHEFYLFLYNFNHASFDVVRKVLMPAETLYRPVKSNIP